MTYLEYDFNWVNYAKLLLAGNKKSELFALIVTEGLSNHLVE